MTAVDITEIILSDHHEQRRMFAMLDEIDRSDTATLDALWTRLSAMLEVHAQAEELFFYPELLKLGERRHEDEEVEETKDAIGDHNDIRDGILASREHDPGTEGWWAGVTAARKANDEHMGEEEHEGLADFRRYVDLDTRHRIAVTFVAYEATNVDGVPVVDKDPDTYIKENS
ncbi:MAG TPA: hemerythrin domain-containing protein [Mycobacteriales bacterium]|jgi:hypothetical protein|nr:hemerythrin domain-containing protein [Mycobacteriales bacterium]